MKALKPIILCADDFGLNRGTSLGILALLEKQRLSAVSCMANKPDFKYYAQELLAFNQQVRIGLHFNLTEEPLLSGTPCFGLKDLLIKTHLRLVHPAMIAKELLAQLHVFTETMGFLPQFIDGHQHIHQFPIIRQVIFNHHDKHLRGIPIRSTYPIISPKRYRWKAKLLAWTGGIALQDELKKQAIPHNPQFAGVYDFAPDVNYRSLFRQWLALATAGTLIMCHPGNDLCLSDSIRAARQLEMNYLMSDAWSEDCQEYFVSL